MEIEDHQFLEASNMTTRFCVLSTKSGKEKVQEEYRSCESGPCLKPSEETHMALPKAL